MHVLHFGTKLKRGSLRRFIFTNHFNSLYLFVRLWWNILVANLATNFQDFVAKVKNLVALAPVTLLILPGSWWLLGKFPLFLILFLVSFYCFFLFFFSSLRGFLKWNLFWICFRFRHNRIYNLLYALCFMLKWLHVLDIDIKRLFNALDPPMSRQLPVHVS